MSLLDRELLSVDDVLLQPNVGVLKSRHDAKLMPFIYSAPMDTVTGYHLAKSMLAQYEVPVICRDIEDKEYVACIKAFNNTATFFAVGATELELKRFIDRVQAALPDLLDGTEINVAIDIAHGDSIVAYSAIAFLREFSFIGDIMSGSICTGSAALRSVEAGCTHLRIGVGPGSVCTTRIMTGIGVPQLSAVYLIDKALKETLNRDNVTLIADGGIRYPGDAVKYLCAGADAIMLGSLLSKTSESPGWIRKQEPLDISEVLSFPLPDPKTTLWKRYRGHASANFQQDHKGSSNRCPEGTSTDEFMWEGETVKSVCERFRGGVASAISYLGLTSIDQLQPENVEFLKISTSTFLESMPHNQNARNTKF